MTPAELRRVRVAILIHFIVLGASTATWSARLPAIKSELRLSDFQLSLALFAVPAGSVLTLALSGRMADAFGGVRVMRGAGVLTPAARRWPTRACSAARSRSERLPPAWACGTRSWSRPPSPSSSPRQNRVFSGSTPLMRS